MSGGGMARPFILKRNGQVVDRLNGNYVGHVDRAQPVSYGRWNAFLGGRLIFAADQRWWAAELLWEEYLKVRASDEQERVQ